MLIFAILFIKECSGSDLCDSFTNIVNECSYQDLIEYKYKEEFSIIEILKEDDMINIFEVIKTSGKISEPTNEKIIENELENLLEEIIIRSTNLSKDEIEDLVDLALIDDKTTKDNIENMEFLVFNCNDQRKIVNIYLDNELEISVDLLKKCLNRIFSNSRIPIKFIFLNNLDIIALENTDKSYVISNSVSSMVVLKHIKKYDRTSHLIMTVDLKKLNFTSSILYVCNSYLKSKILELLSDDEDKDSSIDDILSVIVSNNLLCNRNLRNDRLKEFVAEYEKNQEIQGNSSSENNTKGFNNIQAKYKKYMCLSNTFTIANISFSEMTFLFNEMDGKTLISAFVIFELMKYDDIIAGMLRKNFKNDFFKYILQNIGVFKFTETITAYEAWIRIREMDLLDKVFVYDSNNKSFSLSLKYLLNFKYFLMFFLLQAFENNKLKSNFLSVLSPIYKIFVENSHLIDDLEQKCLVMICNGAEFYTLDSRNIPIFNTLRTVMWKDEIILS